MILTPWVEAAFWRKVNKTEYCWLWTGSVQTQGYGDFRCDNERMLAHRVSYLIAYRSLSDSEEVMHRCRNKLCVRPDHLKLATHKQNKSHEGLLGIRISSNSSGITGVRHYRGAWEARGRQTTLYRGPDLFEACCTRKSWEARGLANLLGEH